MRSSDSLRAATAAVIDASALRRAVSAATTRRWRSSAASRRASSRTASARAVRTVTTISSSFCWMRLRKSARSSRLAKLDALRTTETTSTFGGLVAGDQPLGEHRPRLVEPLAQPRDALALAVEVVAHHLELGDVAVEVGLDLGAPLLERRELGLDLRGDGVEAADVGGQPLLLGPRAIGLAPEGRGILGAGDPGAEREDEQQGQRDADGRGHEGGDASGFTPETPAIARGLAGVGAGRGLARAQERPVAAALGPPCACCSPPSPPSSSSPRPPPPRPSPTATPTRTSGSTPHDGTQLHAGVFLPADHRPGERHPVIIVMGPYTAPNGGATGATAGGPNVDGVPPIRFPELFEEADILAGRYAYVQVDTRGFGGSGGCFEYYGPNEMRDAGSAVEWAAGRGWSSGRVAMWGKSYDAGDRRPRDGRPPARPGRGRHAGARPLRLHRAVDEPRALRHRPLRHDRPPTPADDLLPPQNADTAASPEYAAATVPASPSRRCAARTRSSG